MNAMLQEAQEAAVLEVLPQPPGQLWMDGWVDFSRKVASGITVEEMREYLDDTESRMIIWVEDPDHNAPGDYWIGWDAAVLAAMGQDHDTLMGGLLAQTEV